MVEFLREEFHNYNFVIELSEMFNGYEISMRRMTVSDIQLQYYGLLTATAESSFKFCDCGLTTATTTRSGWCSFFKATWLRAATEVLYNSSIYLILGKEA